MALQQTPVFSGKLLKKKIVLYKIYYTNFLNYTVFDQKKSRPEELQV